MTGPDRKPELPAGPTDADWASPAHVHVLLLMTVTAACVYVCYLLALPFVPSLTWALAFAVLFVPLQRWFETALRPGVAASLAILVIVLIVIVPAGLVTQRVIAEAARGADLLSSDAIVAKWQSLVLANPSLAMVDRIGAELDLPAAVNAFASWVTASAGMVFRGGLAQLVGVLLTFYFLFYFLRDRSAMLETARALSPLSRAQMNRLFVAVGDTIHATVYGTLVVACVQGLLGGLMFWWLGVPGALLWGIVMGLLAIVPVLGAFVIWIPAALYLLLDGSPGKALLLTLWGTVVVGGIDNVLYPILVGNRIKMHSMVAFIAIVGGLLLFGASGLILGPVLFTAAQWLMGIWRHRNDVIEGEPTPRPSVDPLALAEPVQSQTHGGS